MSGARGWIGGGGSPRVFVRLIRGRPPTDAGMNFGLRRDLSPELSALDGPVVADEAASHNPRPSVFGGARVAAEAAPTEEEMDFSSVPPRFATAAASWVKIAFR